MECQREPGPTRRVRLTDQALVAVVVARQTAAAHGRSPTSLDVLIGLGVEPDGWAGHLLRQRGAALVALADRAATPSPRLADLDVVVAGAAERAAPRPPGTRDLLVAALTVGGDDVDDLLESAGYALGDLWPDDNWDAEPHEHPDSLDDGDLLWTASQETVTLAGPTIPPMTPAAARAVGRTRAIAGGALHLIYLIVGAVADPTGAVDERVLLGAVAARRHLERADPAAAAAAPEDAGLEPVLEAVRDLAAGREATTMDLIHALLLAGGTGPLALLTAPHGSDDAPGEADGVDAG
jgi:hypothetical protein